jgi:hypothetical protein
MKRPAGIVGVAFLLVWNVLIGDATESFAADFYLHTTTSDVMDNVAPTATTAKFKDSPAVNRITYQQIGVWTAAPLGSPMQVESLSDLRAWIGLKNSDDQGTYFDLKAEVRKNGTVIASGETKNIQGVTRNASLAKAVTIAFGAIALNQFAAGDVLSIRILTKVADSGGHNNAVGLRMYYDAVSRPSRFGATFGLLPVKLVVAAVNSGANPMAGVPFPVVVQSQTADGIAANVASATEVNLTLNSGAGTLGGNLTGTIAVGTNQVTITGVTYTKAESGVRITAMRTSGDMLSSGDSAPFTVEPGAASALAFITQPGNAAAATTIPGPPTVVIRDGFGNTVTTSTASVTIGIGANPGGGVLSGTTTKNATGGMANFNDLSINQAGMGYTLTASSPGLMGITSTAFNVTGGTGVSLTATPSSLAAGNSFTLSWAQIPNPSRFDWIGLFSPGSRDYEYIDYIYVSCGSFSTVQPPSGTCSFPIPVHRTPGAYEFRLFSSGTFNRIATSNPVTIGPPLNKLMVSLGQDVTAGTPGFSMLVESRTPSGTLANVTSDTGVVVSLTVGNGVLDGTLNGTILAGTSQVTIGLATYSKAESGVVVTATRTSGDELTAGASLPFTVSPGAAAILVFTTQPQNVTAGGTIPGPPTVTVQDNAGNTVISFTGSVSVAIENNPNGGTLSGNLTVTTGPNVSFPSLTINQPGNGYTLIASSADLVSATSNPFNVMSAAGAGAISGVITRLSNGLTITGALVEAFQGTTLRGKAVTNSTGNYSITGLAAGSYTVRASFIGLVPQVVNNIPVADGSTTAVDLSLNFGIAIQSPLAGATINDFGVLVTGLFEPSLAPEVGIKVNGYVALQDGNEFATFVPLDSQTTTLTATLSGAAGNLLAGDSVPITTQLPDNEPVLSFRPFPVIALVSQPVRFSLTSLNETSQIELDGNGDGSIDFTGATLEALSVTFAEPGLYLPTVKVTDIGGNVFTDSAVVQVLDIAQMDAQLRAKWDAMKNALRAGDTSVAANFIVSSKRADYQNLFNNLTIPFASIDQMLGNITYQAVKGLDIEYEMLMNDGPDGDVSYMVLFSLDVDGVWRISFF